MPILYNIYHSISFFPTTYLSFLLLLKLDLKSWTYVVVLQRKYHLNFSTVIQLHVLFKSMFRNLKIGIFLISTLRLIKNAGNWCCRNVVIGKFYSFSWNVYNFYKNDIINNSWFILKTTADFSRLCLFCEKNYRFNVTQKEIENCLTIIIRDLHHCKLQSPLKLLNYLHNSWTLPFVPMLTGNKEV